VTRTKLISPEREMFAEMFQSLIGFWGFSDAQDELTFKAPELQFQSLIGC
jgi:hypothetical protein